MQYPYVTYTNTQGRSDLPVPRYRLHPVELGSQGDFEPVLGLEGEGDTHWMRPKEMLAVVWMCVVTEC